MAGVHGSRCDHAVRARHRLNDVAGIQVVALEDQRIDDDLDDLVAVAGDLRLQHAGDAFDLVLQVARQPEQGPLGHVARQGDHQDREQAQVDLVHRRLVGVLGQLGLGEIDLLAHVGERRVDVEARLELEHDVGAAQVGGRAHLFDAFDVAQLLLHRLDEEALGIGR